MFRAVASVGGLTLLSRLLGFVRDVLTAILLGAGPVADAFFVAFRLPNHFRALLAEGAFNAAFVPVFSALLIRPGPSAAKRFAEAVLALLILAQLPLLIAAEIWMPQLMRVFAPGFSDDPEKFRLAVLFTRITFPYLPLISLVALYGGVLNSLGRFTAAAAAPILLNLCLIAAQFVIRPFVPSTGHALAWGVALAGVVQFLYLCWDAERARFALRLPRPRLTPMTARFFKAFGPAALGAGLTQINLFLDTLIASLLPTGAVSYLYYADRLNQLPLGVIGIAIGTVLLPRIAQDVKRGAHAAAQHDQNRALEWCLIAAVPAAIAFLIAGRPIIAALFQYRAFSAADTAATAFTLAVYALGLPAFIAIRAVQPGFYARSDTATPVRIALIATLANVALKLLLMRPLAQAGLAFATSVASWINFIGLLLVLIRRGHFIPDRALYATLGRLSVAAILLAASLIALNHLAQPLLASPSPVTRLAGLAVILGGGAVSFALPAWALDLGGVRQLGRAIGARRSKAGS